MCKGTVLLYRCWKGGSCIFLVCQALLAVVAGWCVSRPSETCKCGIHNNQSSCRSLCVFFEHACLEANTGLWFLLGAGNGNLISSSCVHLQNKGCIYPLLAAFAVLNASPLPTQTSFCSPSSPLYQPFPKLSCHFLLVLCEGEKPFFVAGDELR